ncbi:MAG: AAA family ATPase [Culicoidibacterales bacterium]
MHNKEIRLVISGTYSTGKTTTATALSIATGIPLINALSAREILTDLYPGRRFQDMNSEELMALGLKRLEERIREEALLYHQTGSFISDGSVLNEWVYGIVRMKVGINPGSKVVHRIAKAILGTFTKTFFKTYLSAYGQVTKMHAKQWYTNIVHLPVEFNMDDDGHRPVSEKYRILSDKELQTVFDKMGLKPDIVFGTQVARIKKIIELYDLPQVMTVEEAVLKAEIKILENRESVSKKIIKQYKEPNIKEKIKIMSKF